MKDKILIPIVLALYIGALALTGALKNVVALSTPYGIADIIAGICVVPYIISLKTLKKTLQRISDLLGW